MFDRFVAVTGHCAPWDIVHLVYRGLAVPLPWLPVTLMRRGFNFSDKPLIKRTGNQVSPIVPQKEVLTDG